MRARAWIRGLLLLLLPVFLLSVGESGLLVRVGVVVSVFSLRVMVNEGGRKRGKKVRGEAGVVFLFCNYDVRDGRLGGELQ